jgi:hypothetical protein
MSVACKDTFWHVDIAVTTDIAHCNANNLKTHARTRLDDVGLALYKLNESCADVATAQKANAHDGRRRWGFCHRDISLLADACPERLYLALPVTKGV